MIQCLNIQYRKQSDLDNAHIAELIKQLNQS